MIKLYNEENLKWVENNTAIKPDIIYADCIYEDTIFTWLYKYWDLLNINGIFILQTDYHTVAEYKILLDSLYSATFVNWLIYKQEWGGVPKKGFPQKHDDILIYCKGKDYYWDSKNILIEKVTAGTKLDKKGTGTKVPCSVFDDLGNFSTISKERIKDSTGRNIHWQKPEKLLRRLLTPFVKEGYTIVDPFMGTGTSGVIAKELNCNYVGIEYDPEVYKIAYERLKENE